MMTQMMATMICSSYMMMTQMMTQMMQSSMENQTMPQMISGATITYSNEQVDTLSATIRDYKEQVAQKVWEPDDDERWEVLVLGYFWYIIIEKEVECKKDMPVFVSRSKAMM